MRLKCPSDHFNCQSFHDVDTIYSIRKLTPEFRKLKLLKIVTVGVSDIA